MSTVIASLLVIMIVLIAVITIWIAIKSILSGGTEQISSKKLDTTLDIKKVTILKNNVVVSVKKNTGDGEIAKIKFSFNSENKFEYFEVDTPLDKLEQKDFSFNLTKFNGSELKKVSVIGYLISGSGGKIQSEIFDNYEISGRELAPDCGDADRDNYQDYRCGGDDCNDNNRTINPESAEVCDLVDNNCNSIIDEGLVQNIYYLDFDSDSYGNETNKIQTCLSQSPLNYVSNNTDCNDNKSNINPGIAEICNGLDDDCDGQIDECATVGWRCLYGSCSAPRGSSGDVTFLKNNIPGLVSWWRLNENANDEMGRNNGVIIDNTNCNIPGKFGSGCFFPDDEIVNYIKVNDSQSLRMTQNFSIIVWYNFTAYRNTNEGCLISKTREEYRICFYGGGWTRISTSNGTYINGEEINPLQEWQLNKWYNLAWIVQGKNTTLYENGVRYYNNPYRIVSGTYNGTYDLILGGTLNEYTGNITGKLNGMMDEVMIFNRSLTYYEVEDIVGMNLSQ